MNRFIVIALIVAAGWYGNHHYKQHESAQPAAQQESLPLVSQASSSEVFRCDGRTHCSQMTSCAEATYFLKNCPGTKMDGDGNGVPCERQWCTAGQGGVNEDHSGRRRFK